LSGKIEKLMISLDASGSIAAPIADPEHLTTFIDSERSLGSKDIASGDGTKGRVSARWRGGTDSNNEKLQEGIMRVLEPITIQTISYLAHSALATATAQSSTIGESPHPFNPLHGHSPHGLDNRRLFLGPSLFLSNI
jgi:hypothetical protein